MATVKKLSKRVRRLSLNKTRTNQRLRWLESFPGTVQAGQAQIAAIAVILDVFRTELEQLGVKDLDKKMQARAEQMKQQVSAAAAHGQASQA